jgi:spore coat polysaccharide biosynthesis protein SpsF
MSDCESSRRRPDNELGRNAAVINVRMGSSRLPGKVLRNICGKPMLGHLIDRLRFAKTIDQILVATSVLAANDPIASFCAGYGVGCFRGPEEDVLGRTLGALRSADARTGIVVYGDGPLVDAVIVDSVVGAYIDAAERYDFVGNDLKTTYPAGMEAEAFSVAALADADRRCTDPAIREHGTLYIRCNPQLYRLLNLEAPASQRRPDLALEVDAEGDIGVIAAILGSFPNRADFELEDIIKFLDAHPQLAKINHDIPRRWKAFRAEG